VGATATKDAPAPAAAAEAGKQLTPYYVFREVDADGAKAWERVSDEPYDANTGDKAIQLYVAAQKAAGASDTDVQGEYLPIPVRSYNPRTVKVETNPRISIR